MIIVAPNYVRRVSVARRVSEAVRGRVVEYVIQPVVNYVTPLPGLLKRIYEKEFLN